jgi:hypothetical protein
MNATSLSPTDFDHPISRTAVLTLINTALRLKEYRFARQVALAWLATFPGDLGINLAHAQALLGEGKYSQVAPIVEDLCQKDPEFQPAQRIRAMAEVTKDPTLRSQALASITTMTGQTKDGVKLPDWAQLAWQSRQALQAGNAAQAAELIHQALTSDPSSPVPAILHLAITRTIENENAVRNLAQVYSTRWPECLQFKLYLAEALMAGGDEPGAVALLHQCAANDAAGQVTSRIWGANHPYKPLWPASLEILFDLPVPAAVSGALGWNQLVGGAPAQPAPTAAAGKSAPKAGSTSEPIAPDVLRSIQNEFDRLARRFRLPTISRSDARYPIYVILSTRHGLESLYGPQTAAAVIAEMNNLVDAVKKRAGWGAMSFLADDPLSTSAYDVKPAPAGDAWKLKLTLHDLDAALSKKGAMVGALLIVGGPEVVPFHRLPNPTDDVDPEILSDNPYASLDENYFVPDWPSGRLPGGSGKDAGLLLSAIRRIVDYQKKQASTGSVFRSSSFLRNLFSHVKKLIPHGPKNRPMKPSFGYSAAVWKQSSLAAFRPIGEVQAFLTCPPTQTGGLLDTNLLPSQLSYFNLHGLQDGPDWYGQRDPALQASGPDYPTALTTKDILNSNQATQFIFSEACYGGYIDQKTEDQSIALKFISSGCQGMVGSTCVSYGSVTTPLIAADLLGYYYWKYLQDGKNAGEALQQAKISLVNDMNKRQGYLDGEDQKTLISFVLYGDPLSTLAASGAHPKSMMRPQGHAAVKVISDARGDDTPSDPVPAELLDQVKDLVDQYLPGLKDADFAMTRQQSMFNDEGHPLPGSQMGAKVKPTAIPSHRVVKVSKQVEFARHIHRHYARVTLDSKGKVVKLVVSR